MKTLSIFLLNISLITLTFGLYTGRFNNYKNHSCIRQCSGSTPMTCEYDWTLELYSTLPRACYFCPQNYTDCLRENCILADGIKKSIEVINKLLPGPAIQVCQGDTIVVNLENMMRSERVTSIHWHGIRQRGTPHMDGVGMVSQCPIMPHSSFQYKFKADDVGTHMWHSHSGVQRADGVFGAFIVRPIVDPQAKLYDYDLPDHYLTVIEWTQQPFQSEYGPYTHSAYYGTIQAIIINGKGSLPNSPQLEVPLETYTVKKGFRYRFRFIQAGIQACPTSLSIDGHNLTIISTDGNPVEPVQVESFVAYPGERYDFVVNANASEAKDYWIKIRGEDDCYWKNLSQRAILRYERLLSNLNDPTILKSNHKWSYLDSYRTGLQLRSYRNQYSNESIFPVDSLRYSGSDKSEYFKSISGKPDKQLFLSMDLAGVDDPEFHPADLYSYQESSKFQNSWGTSVINNIKFEPPHMPPLYNWENLNKNNICNSVNDTTCSGQPANFCQCAHTIEVALNDLVEVFLIDSTKFVENHNAHLHGHHFAVLGIDKIPESFLNNYKNMTEIVQLMDKSGLIKRNFDRPIIRDTLSFPNKGFAVIRFIADNPGFWLFHCHLDSHSDSGMIVMIKVGESKDLPPKPKNWPTCGSFSKEQLEENKPSMFDSIFSFIYNSLKNIFDF